MVIFLLMQNTFKTLLADRNIEYKQAIVSPTIFNNVLWQCLAETETGYWFAHYSIFDKDIDRIEFIEIPKNHELLESYKNNRHVQALIWFSRGFYKLPKLSLIRIPQLILLMYHFSKHFSKFRYILFLSCGDK